MELRVGVFITLFIKRKGTEIGNYPVKSKLKLMAVDDLDFSSLYQLGDSVVADLKSWKWDIKTPPLMPASQ